MNSPIMSLKSAILVSVGIHHYNVTGQRNVIVIIQYYGNT